MSKKSIFDAIKIVSPCSEEWNEMQGNDDVRFCSHCAKHVHDLSAITRKQAKRLIAESKGNLCIRYIRRPDGRIQTVEPKLYKIASRASRLAAGVFSATLTLTSAAYAQGGIAPSRSDDSSSIERSIEKDAPKTAEPAGAISGTVKDPADAIIPNITVTLASEDKSLQKVTATNDEGFYQFVDVPAGTYNVQFEGASGFTAYKAENIQIVSGSTATVDASLAVGEVVTVGGGMAISYDNLLVSAAADGDVETVQKLLRERADVNAKEENGGITALHAAVENGNVEIVRLLLQAGAKPNARTTTSRRTPLMSLDGDATPELVRLLLTYSARVNSTDDEKAGVLLNTVRNYAEPGILQLLIESGAKIDATDKNGTTALIAAASDDNLEIVKVLLGAGADPNLKNKNEETALSETGSEEIRQLLIAHGAINENVIEKSEDQLETERPNN